MINEDWDANKYTQQFSFVHKYGNDVLKLVNFDRMTELKGDDGLFDWIDMFIKKPFESIDEESKVRIIRKVVDKLKPQLFHDGKWYADYVRIRMKAIKELF